MRDQVCSSILLSSALVCLGSGFARAGDERPDALMLRNPDVSQHEIVFRYSGDLWLIDKAGGKAQRLTSAPGPEGFAKFSPDGTKIAFQAGYEGGTDIYVIPITGGIPRRVTHHPAPEQLCDWHPDGERLIFSSSQQSGQQRAPKMFLVKATGGQPEAMPIPYGVFGAIDPTGTWLAYTPLASELRTWKRYRGGMSTDIWIFNLANAQARQLTNEPGYDSQPMWRGRTLIFLSDRDELGVMNLYAHDLDRGTVERLTEFPEFDVRFPSIGPEDVVFENGGRLWRYELATKALALVEVQLPSDLLAARPQVREVSDLARNIDVSPSAKRIVVEARGEIFTLPVEEGFARDLTRTSGVAERYPAWSPDGKWIAYFSDRTGEYELTLRRADGSTFEGCDVNGEQVLTSIGPGWKWPPEFSPDSKRITFSDGAGLLWMVTIDTRELEQLDIHPLGQPIGVDWSADSGWIAWNRASDDSRVDAIYLYELATKTRHQVTSGTFADTEPVFDRKGEWLFFQSSRTFTPIYSDFDQTWVYTNSGNLMAVPLRADVKNPWAPKNDEEGDEEAKKEDSKADETAKEEEKKKEEDKEGEADALAKADEKKEEAEKPPEPVRIEIEGFESRVLPLPVDPGPIGNLSGLAGKLLYVRSPRSGESGSQPRIQIYDLEKKEEKTVLADAGNYVLAAKGEKLFVRAGDKWGVVEPKPDQKIEKPIDRSGLVAQIDPREEWRQMLVDCWRLFRDFFYDERMHGLDWPAIRDRYLGALVFATSREDLHFLLSEMMSELNVGHAYNPPPPKGLELPPPGPTAGLLGCDWKLDSGQYHIVRILGGGAYDADARSPLALPGAGVRAGDFLLAVNGIPVDPSQDVYAAFLGTADKPTQITVNENPLFDGKERVALVKPLANESELRYRTWVADERALVDQRSGGRIGYVHVPDTGIHGQNELVRQFMSQMRKEALIVDERWNSGGQIPSRFIELLDRPITNYWAVRHGATWEWPPVGHRGPKAMLINHSSGSGGDCFPYYFRQQGLGKLIGTRTWGGLVGLSGNPGLIDGAQPTVPTFGFFELDGTWGVEGYGVAPDIEVVDDPSKMQNGEDPQLETAIGSLLAELAANPSKEVARPASPDRHRPGLRAEDH